MTRRALKQIIKARRTDKSKAEARAKRSHAEPNDGKDNVKYYSQDFKVSDRGVFARKIDDKGHPFWDKICTTRIDLEALTRDVRGGNWGTYIIITNRDGEKKKLAVPLALIGADKVTDIAGLLASLGVGIVPSRQARQLLVQFLTLDVIGRVTAVPQIGWHCSGATWLFVLPDDTIVPTHRCTLLLPANGRAICSIHCSTLPRTSRPCCTCRLAVCSTGRGPSLRRQMAPRPVQHGGGLELDPCFRSTRTAVSASRESRLRRSHLHGETRRRSA